MEEAGEHVEDIRAQWSNDVSGRDTFFADQQRNRSGEKGNRWSMVTYRLALAVFTRSPAAYESLKSFNILQLPSVRSLRQYTGGQFDEPGYCEEAIQEQFEKYERFQEAEVKAGKKRPLGEGRCFVYNGS